MTRTSDSPKFRTFSSPHPPVEFKKCVQCDAPLTGTPTHRIAHTLICLDYPPCGCGYKTTVLGRVKFIQTVYS